MVHCFLTGWMITPPHHLFLHYVTSVRGGGSQRYTHVYFSIHNSDMTKWVLFVVSTWQTVTDLGFVFLTVVWHPVTCGRVANHTKCQLQGACVCASEFICSCVLDTHCFLKITFHLALTDNSFWCIVLFFSSHNNLLWPHKIPSFHCQDSNMLVMCLVGTINPEIMTLCVVSGYWVHHEGNGWWPHNTFVRESVKYLRQSTTVSVLVCYYHFSLYTMRERYSSINNKTQLPHLIQQALEQFWVFIFCHVYHEIYNNRHT